MKRLLVIWLMTQTSVAGASDFQADVILGKGRPAPFYGVLVSEDSYRAFKTFEFENESLAKALADSPSSGSHGWLWFVVGLASGAALTSTLGK